MPPNTRRKVGPHQPRSAAEKIQQTLLINGIRQSAPQEDVVCGLAVGVDLNPPYREAFHRVRYGIRPRTDKTLNITGVDSDSNIDVARLHGARSRRRIRDLVDFDHVNIPSTRKPVVPVLLKDQPLPRPPGSEDERPTTNRLTGKLLVTQLLGCSGAYDGCCNVSELVDEEYIRLFRSKYNPVPVHYRKPCDSIKLSTPREPILRV